MLKKQWFIFLAGLVLTACSSLPNPVNNTAWQAQRDWAYFSAEGRIGVRTQDKGYSAGFEWLREHGVETFDVLSPLGNTLASVCRDKKGVVVADAGGRIYVADAADSLEMLSRQWLGDAVPVPYLVAWANGEWVRGVPHAVHADGSLAQAGWRVVRESDDEGKPKALQLDNERWSVKLLFHESARTQGQNISEKQCAIRSTIREENAL